MATDRINLLPLELVPPSLAFEKTLLVLSLVVASGMAVSFITRARALDHLDQRLQMARAEKTKLDDKISVLTSEQAARTQAKDQQNPVQSLVKSRFQWSEMFKELTLLETRNVWLNLLVATKENGDQKVVMAGESASPAEIALFLDKLETSLFFRQAHLEFTENLNDYIPRLFRFQISSLISAKEQP